MKTETTNDLPVDDEFAALERAIAEADNYRREVYAKPQATRPEIKADPPKMLTKPQIPEPQIEIKTQGSMRTSAAALAQFSDAELDRSIESLGAQVQEAEQKLETLRFQLAAAKLEKTERQPQPPKKLDLDEAVQMLIEARTGSGKTGKVVEWLAKRNGEQK